MKYIKNILEMETRKVWNIRVNLFKEIKEELNYILEDIGCQELEISSPIDSFRFARLTPIGYDYDTDYFVLIRFPRINANGVNNVNHLLDKFFESDEYLEWFDRAEEICEKYQYVLEKNSLANTHDSNGVTATSYNREKFVIAFLYKK